MSLRVLTAGESHGPELTVIVEGFPAGVPIDVAAIDADLRRRQQGYGRGARSTRIEHDRASVTAGVADGRSTGAPIAMRIPNRDFANQPDHPAPLTAPRPGHADLAGRVKYGHEDFRIVRERASARETAARVAAGALAKQLLAPFGCRVGGFVTAVGEEGAGLPVGLDLLGPEDLVRLAGLAEDDELRTPDPAASDRMRAAVDRAREAGETLGGIFCVFAVGAPPGLGSYAQWDRRLDGRLAQAVCSIHAVKGVEIGPAFAVARRPGRQAQDAIEPDGVGGLRRGSNRAGGLEGGVSNGEPIVLQAAMKPLSSVRAAVASVDMESGQAVDPPYVRSDVCAVPPAVVVAEAMVAWVLADALCERFGQDRLDGMVASYAAIGGLPRPRDAGR